jgi:hypothetical protein
MKNKSQIQSHPNQEDKTGKATYAAASTTKVNSSTVSQRPDANDMPEGAESKLKRRRPRPQANTKRTGTK